MSSSAILQFLEKIIKRKTSENGVPEPYLVWATFAVAFISVAGLFFLQDLGYKIGYRTHTWTIGYYRDYFLHHLNIPDIFNVSNHRVGNVYPIFYGKYFYFISALFSIVLDVQYGLFFTMILFSFFLSYYSYRLFYELTARQNKFLALGFSIILVWAIYPLTNFQSRTAFVEWFANTNIVLGCILWYLSIFSRSFRGFLITKILFVIFMILGVNGHAITTYYSSYIVVILLLFSFKLISDYSNHDNKNIKRHIISLIIGTIVIVIVSLPWLLACFVFMNKIHLGNTIKKLQFLGYINADYFWNKLSFFAGQFSGSFIDSGVAFTSLQAQIIMPYVILIIFFLTTSLLIHRNFQWRAYSLFSFLSGVMALFILLSTSRYTAGSWLSYFPNHFSFLFAKQQFAYRSTNQINLLLLFSLASIIFQFYHISNSENNTPYILYKKILSVLLIIFISVSYCNVMIKQRQLMSKYISSNNVLKNIPRLDSFKNQNYTCIDYFHGIYAYYVYPKNIYKDSQVKDEVEVFFNINDKENYGAVQPANISLTKKTKVNLNITPFPWNFITINDKIYGTDELYYKNDKLHGFFPTSEKRKVFLILDKGEYTIKYIFKPGRWYIVMNAISKTIFLTIFILLICIFVFVRNNKYMFISKNSTNGLI